MSDDPETEGKCSVVIALMQEHRRSREKVKVKALQIGFILYQVCVCFTFCSKSLCEYKLKFLSIYFRVNLGHFIYDS